MGWATVLIEVYFQSFEGIIFAVATTNHEVVASAFSSDKKTALNSILRNLPLNMPFQVYDEPTPKAKEVLKTLKDIYDGKDPKTTLALATERKPGYTKKVLQATLVIPVGYVTTYGAIAKAVGGGARAVGNAMACNQFPMIVPCHRVVKSDFGLGGYGAGGLGVKLEFLRREKRGYSEPKTIKVCGGQLCIFPVEHVLIKYE